MLKQIRYLTTNEILVTFFQQGSLAIAKKAGIMDSVYADGKLKITYIYKMHLFEISIRYDQRRECKKKQKLTQEEQKLRRIVQISNQKFTSHEIKNHAPRFFVLV